MMSLLPLVLLAAASQVPAAERKVSLATVDHIRLQGPIEVAVVGERLPVATLTGDPAAIDAVEVLVEGTTLTIRRRMGRAIPSRTGGEAIVPVRVTLGSDVLVGASVIGGGRLRIARMRGPRIDLSLTGVGELAVADLQTTAANATVIGDGAMTLSGRAGAARLMTNGAGTIDAGGLEAGDLFVRLDGPGTTKAAARYTARVIDSGTGQVDVAGRPKCSVTAQAGGPVTCNGYTP